MNSHPAASFDTKDLFSQLSRAADEGQIQIEGPPNIIRFLFSARKPGFPQAVSEVGSRERRSIFEEIRPTANQLTGYTPSQLLNRFQAEQGYLRIVYGSCSTGEIIHRYEHRQVARTIKARARQGYPGFAPGSMVLSPLTGLEGSGCCAADQAASWRV